MNAVSSAGPGGKRSPARLPVLPLRDVVLFPAMAATLYVGRARSVAALEQAVKHGNLVLVVTQKSAKVDDPEPSDLHHAGAVARLLQNSPMPDGTRKILVEGLHRARAARIHARGPCFEADVEEIAEIAPDDLETHALIASTAKSFSEYASLNKRLSNEAVNAITASSSSVSAYSDFLAANLNARIEDKQALLEEPDARRRLEKVYELMQQEIEILQLEGRIRSRVKKQMERSQKEYYLNEQMAAIQKELGERDEFRSELAELEEKIESRPISGEAREKCRRELRKLKMMSPMSAEATVVRNYIDWVISLPWNEKTEDKVNIEEAEKLLNREHFGLRKVKERIIEYLAVEKLTRRAGDGPILCLAGPPGVGKTSLARSIASATGRKFVRVSLGGVRDEAEIRGHRRTYIGAMPGKIIQSLRKAGSNNPVFLLDEIDKMSTDFRGDPASALLEVLDPEQNKNFVDHFLDLDYNVSECLFITTANNIHEIPAPLRDRLEIIRLSGYTDLEKEAIALRYLIPKQFEATGLADAAPRFSREAIQFIIHRYTLEAGVRGLDREIASICRKLAIEQLKKKLEPNARITRRGVVRMLGAPRYQRQERAPRDEIGIATGLAWTELGGTLMKVEVSAMPGHGRLTVTGQVGNVMQESAQAALSYLRTRAEVLGLSHLFNEALDVHIHVPEGSIPKDGPSAGITMATAMISELTQIAVHADLAMTGEINLRGRVLPIGGLKEKVMAAHRAGLKRVIFPAENRKDLRDIPRRVRDAMELIPVSHMDEVLQLALGQDELRKHLDRQRGARVTGFQPSSSTRN
ncbi:MAG: Lon protease 1 [Myxococcota bacterium]|nr:Lon protease 1 [Myxococcota bacterium]